MYRARWLVVRLVVVRRRVCRRQLVVVVGVPLFTDLRFTHILIIICSPCTGDNNFCLLELTLKQTNNNAAVNWQTALTGYRFRKSF